MIYEIARIAELYKAIKIMATQILPAENDDLTQEVMTKLWTRRKHLPRRFGGSYLRVVVRNSAYDFIRKQRKSDRLVRFSVNDNGSISPANEPGKQFFVSEPVGTYRDQRDCLKDVDQALETLSAEQRQTIELTAAGFECAEIAEKTGVPTGTVRTRLFYARKKLNKVIGE